MGSPRTKQASSLLPTLGLKILYVCGSRRGVWRVTFTVLAVLFGDTFSFCDRRRTDDLPVSSGGENRKSQFSVLLSPVTFSSLKICRLILSTAARSPGWEVPSSLNICSFVWCWFKVSFQLNCLHFPSFRFLELCYILLTWILCWIYTGWPISSFGFLANCYRKPEWTFWPTQYISNIFFLFWSCLFNLLTVSFDKHSCFLKEFQFFSLYG